MTLDDIAALDALAWTLPDEVARIEARLPAWILDAQARERGDHDEVARLRALRRSICEDARAVLLRGREIARRLTDALAALDEHQASIVRCTLARLSDAGMAAEMAP